MNINDWNKSILLAKKIQRNLIKQGIICTNTTKTTKDNTKSICFHVLNTKKNIYNQYDSDVQETFEKMEIALKNLETYILKNHKRQKGDSQMNNQPRINQGYTIIKSCFAHKAEIVIGHNPNAPNPYACWYCKNGNDYYWGYYCNTLEAANEKLNERSKLC